MKSNFFLMAFAFLVFFSSNSEAQVTVYKDINYGGTTQTFNEGFHKGYFQIGNDVISSVKVQPGYKLTLYEHGVGNGRELVLYSDAPDLMKLNFNDIASNLKVEKVGNSLEAGQTLKVGERLVSSNGSYYVIMQDDGNLCVYTAQNGFKWCSMKHGFKNGRLDMQTDGNLVVYDANNKAQWASETVAFNDQKWAQSGMKPVKMIIENDGKLNLYNSSGKVVWSNQ